MELFAVTGGKVHTTGKLDITNVELGILFTSSLLEK